MISSTTYSTAQAGVLISSASRLVQNQFYTNTRGDDLIGPGSNTSTVLHYHLHDDTQIRKGKRLKMDDEGWIARPSSSEIK